MFCKTKNDLNGHSVTLDLDALKLTADVAQGQLLDYITTRLNKVRDARFYEKEKHNFTCEMEQVEWAFHHLQRVTEVQSALYGMDKRSAVEWANWNLPEAEAEE